MDEKTTCNNIGQGQDDTELTKEMQEELTNGKGEEDDE